jgi:hypothetical protein
MDSRIIDIPTQNRTAALLPDSVNSDERTVELIWSTGAAVRRTDWWSGETYDETLSLTEGEVDLSRLNNGAPFLNSHNSYELDSILGVVTRAWIDGGIGKAEVKIDNSEAGNEVLRKIKDKILRNVSVGYSVSKYEKTVEDGKVPVYRAIDWQPCEISAVCIGADAGAGFRSKPVSNHCLIIQKREEPTMPDPEIINTPAVPDTPIADPAPAASTETETVAAIVAEERARCAGILATASKLGVPDSFARSLIEKGVSLAGAKDALIDHAAENSPTAAIRSHIPADKPKEKTNQDLPVEERTKTEWDGNPSLRSEFGGYNTYLAYQRSIEAGKVRIKSN